MTEHGHFPFGSPVYSVHQEVRSRKQVFVLGVYASAVHARWIGEDGRQKMGAVGIASEPEIFWCGGRESAQAAIARISLPSGAGHLEPTSDRLNGPSGRALDDRFLKPLGLEREAAWLCDLVPHSCMNEKQAAALKREYDPCRETLGLPAYGWPLLPRELADANRRMQIEQELEDSGANILITLGDMPLKWFASHYGSARFLRNYGTSTESYGQTQSIEIRGRKLRLLPLVHPRQAARLSGHSAKWADLHDSWMSSQDQGRIFT
jgi:uracil-DNA glycosylase